MCILFIYVNSNPSAEDYKLILASNRDEYFARPAASAAQWIDVPHAFGGLDMEPGREGGTWLAISGKNGVIKVGALLNITGEKSRLDAAGRGPIVVNYVKGNQGNDIYCQELIKDPHLYNAFNFVSAEIRDNEAKILNCSNAPPSIKCWPECKPHGFGNSPVDTPFHKVEKGTMLFEEIIKNQSEDHNSLVKKCMDLLKLETKFWPDDEILRRAPQWGENLSSICVRDVDFSYGSRTSTVILVDCDNKMDLFEETMISTDPNGEWKHTHIERQL